MDDPTDGVCLCIPGKVIFNGECVMCQAPCDECVDRVDRCKTCLADKPVLIIFDGCPGTANEFNQINE